jgi:hypothetical protein
VLAWRAQRSFGLPRFRLLAIAPVAGLGRVTGAVPGVAALGYDIEAALVDPDDQ